MPRSFFLTAQSATTVILTDSSTGARLTLPAFVYPQYAHLVVPLSNFSCFEE